MPGAGVGIRLGDRRAQRPGDRHAGGADGVDLLGWLLEAL